VYQHERRRPVVEIVAAGGTGWYPARRDNRACRADSGAAEEVPSRVFSHGATLGKLSPTHCPASPQYAVELLPHQSVMSHPCRPVPSFWYGT
jgi:hypothetical protein